MILDLIAIPDFPYEASETWGLTMFRESSILYSSTTDSAITRQNVALIVAQEMAHMVKFSRTCLILLLKKSDR